MKTSGLRRTFRQASKLAPVGPRDRRGALRSGGAHASPFRSRLASTAAGSKRTVAPTRTDGIFPFCAQSVTHRADTSRASAITDARTSRGRVAGSLGVAASVSCSRFARLDVIVFTSPILCPDFANATTLRNKGVTLLSYFSHPFSPRHGCRSAGIQVPPF